MKTGQAIENNNNNNSIDPIRRLFKHDHPIIPFFIVCIARELSYYGQPPHDLPQLSLAVRQASFKSLFMFKERLF
jgi:hypothetical protein